jgi:hypothetical protein
MTLCVCYDMMRDLSRQGFTIELRPGARAKRLAQETGLYVRCVRCGDGYGIRPTRAKTRDQLNEAQGVLAGVA